MAYGFAPVLKMDADVFVRGVHSVDESIDIDDLAEMAAFHLRALEAMSGRMG